MPGQDTNPADYSSDMNVELDNSWENGRPSSSPSTVNRESDARQETSASNTTNNSFQLCQNIQLEDSSDWSHRLPSTSAPSPSWQNLTHDEPGAATSTSNSTFRNYIYGGSSDSGSESDDAQVNCPVCFVSLLNREVATPDSCQHYFCCPCLKQWSTTVTTCPVDRRKFKLILVRNNIGGQVIRVDPVDPVSVHSFSDNEDDPTYCQVCHQSDREDRMLLCDYCDSGFHLECLNPPLDAVPDGDWFCSRCQLLIEEIISVSSDDESEVEVVTRSGRRVRRPSVSSNSDSARAQKKTPPRREPVDPTSTTRKKVTGRTPSLRGEGSFSHTRRRRQRQQNTSESSPQTVEDSDEDGEVRTARKSGRSRLAENLGLVPCRRSHSSSTTHASAPVSCLNRQRVSAGIPTLNLFGNDSLDYFSDGSDGETGNEGGGSRVLCHRSRSSPTAARRLAARKLSQSLMSSTSRPRVNLNSRPSTSRDTTLSSRHSLLDSIMESQGLWHSRNTTVSLRRDGTITIKKASEVERPSEAMPDSNNGPSSSTVTEPSDRNRERIQNDSNPQELSSHLFSRRDTLFTSRAGSSRSLNSMGQQASVNNRFPWDSHTSNRISVTDNRTRVSQVPLYPGNSNNSRSPGSSGSYHHNDSQYERSSTSSYQYSGHTYSSTHHSGFDSDRGHLGYSGYLGPDNSSTTSDLPNSGRFNLLPQFTRRTHPHPSTSLSTSSTDERQLEESDFLDDPDVSNGKSSNERDSKKNTYRKVTEDDDLDIYSDIEVSSAGGQNCASEHEDNERSFDVLPPPPEPSALLIGLGEQDSSDSETNDSLVIDIRPNPDDHTPKDNATKSPDESEKYDPAVPCDDSDDDDPVVSQNLQKEDIPLPPCPPSSENIDMSTSNASYLQSPTYGELSKQCSVHVTEAVTEAVKEVINSTLQSSSASINKTLASGDEDDDEGECPNFSIYSADSMDIARKATEIPEENSNALDKSDTVTTDKDKVEVEKCEAKTDILEMPVELSSDHNNQECGDNDEQMEETGSISEIQEEPLENNEDMIEQFSKTLHCSSRSSSSCSSSSSSCCSSSSSSSGSSSSSSSDGSSVSQNTSCEEPNKEATPEDIDIKAVSVEQGGDQTSNVCAVQTVGSGASENNEKSAITDDNITKNEEIVELDQSGEKENLVVEPASAVSVVSSDNAAATQIKTALSVDNTAPSLNSSLPATTPVGLEGLDTETISETEEAINFDDDTSHDETSLLSEEDGEISPQKKRKKATDEVKDNSKVDNTVSVEQPQLEKDLSPAETVDYEEGEIVDERPRQSDVAQKDKILDKDKRHESNEIRSADEAEMSECSVHIGIEGEKKKKKKKSSDRDRDRDRAELSVNDDEDTVKGKGSTLDDSISWKKPSKGTKERNYRDSKTVKPTEKGKDSSRKENEDKELPKKEKKKKEKRKDMERYDVRKIVGDKKRKRKDEFGRDLSRDRSYSRSRSRSKSRGKSRDRSSSLSRSKTNRTKGRSSPRRSRHRSRSRSRSRSYRSRSRSKNKSLSKLKDRNRKSRSKERQRKASRDRSRSRNRRSRSRSGSRLRNRSRSRSIHKSREGKDRSRAAVRQKRPPKNRRSWSRTWTPSWSRSRSRSRSRSVSCSSYSRSPSPSARRYNRSYSRSFSRSWSRERHERVPLMEKKTNTVSKPPKKLTVIVNNSKEDSERQRKKEKKKKDSRKSKDQSGAEKRKKRKERSPLPSKEVFTSGDNILVSVNFNKSNKGPGAAVAAAAAVTSASICALPKDTSKRKQRDDTFDGRETTKKSRKDKSGKEKTSKGLNSNAANTDKTQNRKSKKATKADKRLAALLRQKPVAIIDLDQSPFREQTPSPRDLIVLSDSDDAQRDKETEMEDGMMTRMMHQEILSPQNSLKMSATARTPESQSPVMSSVSNYLNTSTGPKTPPEPQIKFSIAAKPQLRSISNPLREEDDDLMAEDTVLDESDRQMDEDLDRDIMHKGPNTPPEPRGPTTPCSPPISPDAYDPFDPTKSGTPSPVREEVNELQSPSGTPCEEVMQHSVGVTDSPIQSDLDDTAKKTLEMSSEIPLIQSSDTLRDDVTHSPDRTKSITMIETMLGNSPSNIDESVVGASQHQLQVEVSPSEPGEKSSTLSVTMIVPMNSDITPLSPEIKIIPMTVQQQKLLKQNIVQQQPVTSTPTHCSTPSNYANLPTSIASTPISPLTSTPVSRSNVFSTPIAITVPQLSSHHLPHSPVVSQQRAVGIKTVPEKVTSISYVKSLPQRPTGQQNGDQKEQIQDTSTEVVDMDLDSPYSPGSSEGDDLFEPPSETVKPTAAYPPMNTRSSQTPQKNVRQSLPAVGNTPNKPPDKFDALFGMSPARNKGSSKMGKIKTHHSKSGRMKGKLGKGSKKEIQIKMDEDQLQILDDLPSSAVELQVKDKFLKKLNRQERVVEEVKLSLKPYYTSKKINKEEYKEILRRSVPKICHNRSGEINPKKISALVDAYVLKYRYLKKKQLSSQRKQSKPQKTTMWS